MNQTRNCIYIPSIDARDLYLADNIRSGAEIPDTGSLSGNDTATSVAKSAEADTGCKAERRRKTGYSLITQSGSINYKRFTNSLDYSLDLEKLRETAAFVYGKKDVFTFVHDGKEYSDKIINVTFEYSSREFNKVAKDTYVREGYSFRDLEFTDQIATELNKVVGVIVAAPTSRRTIYDLPEGFDYAEDEQGNHIYTVSHTKVLYSRKDLRDYLYENGFFCNGFHYIRFKRTSGSARLGKCLFVEESLYSKFHEWEMCGLTIQKGDPVDLAALESYLSLPTSSAIDLLQIEPENILVIPDCDSVFQEASVIVEMDEHKKVTAREGEAEISNSIFDGQSLIDKSIMGKYDRYGMVLLRNRFFKSCCFNTNIQDWFRDKGITRLSQLHRDSITIAEKVEDIKLITTPNSIKYSKFAPILQWLKTIDSAFSVVKHEKKTHFFNGKMVQAHYQLLNTLQLTPGEVHQLLEPSLKYVNLLNTDIDVLRYHVKCCAYDSDHEEITNVMKDKFDIVYKMLGLSEAFSRTKYFYDFKKEVCKSYLKNMKKGHILINGNYSVLFGNPFEMLLHAIGEFHAETGKTSLPPGTVHTTRYPYGRKILGCRSPHISTSNILISTNIGHDLIDKYFNLTDEIICLNAIQENVMERLSGCDYDSDQMIVSDNEILIQAALKNYALFKVPANRIHAEKSQRCYTYAHQSDLDYRTSENKIGEIVNLSQELNTLMWDMVNRSGKELSECYEDMKELYHDICILNVLSCVEIDKAKKEFDISSTKEIRAIKEKWERRASDDRVIKPAFLGFVAQTKGYRDPCKKRYDYHRTTMDYLLQEINRYRSAKTDGSHFIPLSECFRFDEFHGGSVNRKQTSQIVKMCEAASSAIHGVWADEFYTLEEKFTLTMQYKDDLMLKIHKMKVNKHTLYTCITFTDMKKYSHISRLLFYVMFHYKNELLTELMKGLKSPQTYIRECSQGELELYGIPFKRYGGNQDE